LRIWFALRHAMTAETAAPSANTEKNINRLIVSAGIAANAPMAPNENKNVPMNQPLSESFKSSNLRCKL